MNFSTLTKSLSATVVGLLAIATPALAQPGDNEIGNYVGLGARSGLNDSFAVVIDSKFEIFKLDQNTVSVRPAIYVGDDFEGRLPISYDVILDEQLLFFGGGGFAYNFEDSDFDPMLTAGLDMPLSERLILNVEGNLILKSNDTDAEIAGSINWRF
ncbi:hypothetical protein [Leptothoe sp. PORK10 BA2]|uniref:hypothetical protein n=1 Tax=Leptothoe sp. PORK10 BA2 TaxID=3110254 RepID=UPI002B203200|nr:hypothetical protein [Leptothoe sp. PORK10 BA2]MEA5465635.1 hypothetical protein [Leptothoe sp. PORK10 BA2]